MVRKHLLLTWLLCIAFIGTALAQKTLPYSYGFENNNLGSEGWTMVKTDDMNFMGITDETSHSGDYSFKFSSYDDADSYDQYLISPLLDAPNGLVMQFYYTAYNYGTEVFRVGYSTSNDNLSSFTFEEPITDVVGMNWRQSEEYEFPQGTKYVVFHYYSDYQYYLYLDDIDLIAPSSCSKPSQLTVGQFPNDGTQVSLGWAEDGEATSWQICLNGDENNLIAAPTNPFTITDLTPETSYTAKVRANCGSEVSRWSNEISFTPSTHWTIGSGSQTTWLLPLRTDYHYSYTQQIYTAQEMGAAGMLMGVEFYNTEENVTRNVDLYLVSTYKNAFNDADDWVEVHEGDLVFGGEVTFVQDGWTTIEFQNDFEYDGSSNIVLVVDDNTNEEEDGNDFLSFPTEEYQSIFCNSDYNNLTPWSHHSDNVKKFKNQIRLLKGDQPNCPKPSNLTVNYTGGTTAVVSWSGDALSWNLKLNGVQRSNITNPYTLDELEYGTVYTVEVQANCSGDEHSNWSVYTFQTEWCDPVNQCLIHYELTDSYGDSWNDNAIHVVDAATGITLDTWTIAEDTTFVEGSLVVCEGRDLRFVWELGEYPDEASWVIFDVNGEEIYQGRGDDLEDGEVFYVHTVSCQEISCIRPRRLTLDSLPTAHTLTLTWIPGREDDDLWEIAYKAEEDEEFSFLQTDQNPCTIPGLLPSTTYTVKMRTVCGTDDFSLWTDENPFTTDVACHEVFYIQTYDVTPTTATIDWYAWADLFDVRCAAFTYNEEWLLYDNGTIKTNIGNSDPSYWTWGVKFPPSMLGDNSFLSNVSIYENDRDTDEIIIQIYSGGENAPQDLIYEGVIEPTGEKGFHEIPLLEVVEFDPHQNLWIVLSEWAKHPVHASICSEPNNQWIFYNGSWVSIGTVSASFANYGWMIRAKVHAIPIEELDWMTTEEIEEYSYTLENLEPVTGYIAQVRSNCGEDGYSNWASTLFNTPDFCTVPFDLSTDNLRPTTTDLFWNGYVDEYDVRYRVAGGINMNILDRSEQVGTDMVTYNELEPYSFDLSGFSGTGYVAIRHYNVTGKFYMNVDDIEITNAQGEQILFEDFEDGALPSNWLNVDKDGDGYRWLLRTSGVMNGSYCATSASYMNGGIGALHPDDWLIIPDVELGGTLTFYAAGQGSYSPNEVFGVFVFKKDPQSEQGEWIPVSVSGTSTSIEDLVEETIYEFQVQGHCEGDATTGWSDSFFFETPPVSTAPFDLYVTDVTNQAATLHWTGFTDEFNVRYRAVESIQQVGEDVTTTDELELYSFDLSGFTGTGAVVIRHYHCQGLYYLDLDNILITNADDDVVIDEDFEHGFPRGWYCVDQDGDGYGWNRIQVIEDIYGEPIGYGSYCLNSASYLPNHGTLTPDNWLVIPDVELGGTLTLYARGQDADEYEEVFGVYVMSYDEWEEEHVAGETLLITGLMPETFYESQVQGIYDVGVTNWSESYLFQTDSASSYSIEIRPGWNWISSNKEYTETSITEIQEVLENTGSSALIKSQDQFTKYENGQWFGQLTTLDNTQMYMVSAEDYCMFDFSGGIALPENHPITLTKGWNWVSFLGVEEIPMTDALADIDWRNQDLIKYQSQFAQYSSTYGWVGSLTTMCPGFGYMYCSYNDDPTTFTYPSIGSSKAAKAVTQPTHWKVNTNQFPTNLSMMVTVDLPSDELIKGDYEIGAFVNGECRGAAHCNYYDGIGRTLAFLSVSGEEGDMVCFKLYDANAEYVLPEIAAEKIVYTANAIYGSIETPMMLHFNCNGLNEDDSSVMVFPNPTDDKVFINGTEIQNVKVFNALGQCLYSEEVGNVQQVELSLAAYPAGIYTVTLHMEDGKLINKMIVRQ